MRERSLAIWAEAETGAATLFTVAALVLTSISTTIAGYLAYLSNRDRLAFDAKTKAMEQALAECQQARGEHQARLQHLQDRAETAVTAAARLEGELEGLRTRVLAQDAEIDKLRDLLYRTQHGGHP